MFIATIINFCSNEYRFLKHCITEAEKYSSVIHIALADHFFDGQPEDLSLIKSIAEEFPQVNFFLYPFLGSRFTTHEWHNVSRLVAYHFLPSKIDHILFLDADEIVDGNRFATWLKTYPYQNYNFLKLSCYWYFRAPSYQAHSFETSPLFARKKSLTRKLLMHPDERSGLFTHGKGPKLEGASDGKPLIHHYSWVRTQEEMLRKVRSWGHKNDRNWEELVNEEFSRPFSGRDFVHHYDFATVTPFINLDFAATPKPFSGKDPSNVKILSPKQLLRIIYGPWRVITKYNTIYPAYPY